MRIDHDRVLDLWAAGYSRGRIGREVKAPAATVQRIVVRARHRGDPRAIGRNMVVSTSVEIQARIARRAVAMGVSVPEVVSQVVRIVFGEGLEAAVFDDGVEA